MEQIFAMFFNKLASITLIAMSSLGAGALRAQDSPRSGAELKFVVIMTRHGVRPPLWTDEQLNQYSTQTWPKWDVPAGHLTAHGAELLKMFGAYDRAQFAKAGLLPAKGCADADKVYIWADTDQRTIATGRALSEGMLPGCGIQTNSLAEGDADPIFSPLAAGIGHPSQALAVASVAGRIGGHADALLEAYRPALETLEEILLGCKSGAKCLPAGPESKLSLLTIPASVGPAKGDKLAEMKGPISAASTMSENFLLEYTNGMTGSDLGWGRLDEAKLRQVMSVHTAYENLLRRDPYIGRASASNMLSHILKSMEQAIAGKAVAGAIGQPEDRVLVLAGHDGNVSNIAGTLDLSWLLPGYQPNDTPPDGALFFELWRQPNGEYQVRTYYTAQTLEQMHKALPLTPANPPAVAPLFLPGCSEAGPGMPCAWKAFQHKVETAIDPSMVKP
jgi:4-phytase/acid phosphatase